MTALTLRNSHRDHDFQRDMHDITEQIKRIAMMLLLLAFGGSITVGLLENVGWTEIASALLILLVLRPVAGRFIGVPEPNSVTSSGSLSLGLSVDQTGPGETQLTRMPFRNELRCQ